MTGVKAAFAAASALLLLLGLLYPASSYTLTTTRRTRATNLRMSNDVQAYPPNGKTNVIAGATGYIGKAVVRESVRQGYQTIALVRDVKKVQSLEGKEMYDRFFEGAKLVECDVENVESLTKTLADISASAPNTKIESVISCLASRSGIKKDAFAVDYQATLNCLNAGRMNNARHFVLLSAFCVKKPWLQFQHAKLKFEAALQEQTDLTWSIVRPTAFFKSVSGKLEIIRSGAPFVMFGDGDVRCNPISEADLARYLIDCISDKTLENKIVNLGGPDEPITMKQQGEMMYAAIGEEPNYFHLPLWLFDVIINSLQGSANVFNSEPLENAAEIARIIKYYAVEDMLTTHPEEKFGTMRLQDHYNKIAKEGQEYDPYITMYPKALSESISLVS